MGGLLFGRGRCETAGPARFAQLQPTPYSVLPFRPAYRHTATSTTPAIATSTTPSPSCLGEEVVEGLVGVGDHQGALAGAVVVQDVHDLHRRVRLARACAMVWGRACENTGGSGTVGGRRDGNRLRRGASQAQTAGAAH